MGIAAFVLGLISLILGFIPFCGIIALIPALIGLILGIVDVVLKSKKKEKKGFGIAGIVMSALAVIITILWFVLVGVSASVTNDILNDALTNNNNILNTLNNSIYDYDYDDGDDEVDYSNLPTYGLNEAAKLEDTVITVNSVQKSSGIEYQTPKSGYEFVIVEFTIENKGDSRLYYNPFDFYVQNSNGVIDEYAWEDLGYDTLSSGYLATDGKITSYLVFEEPINDPELTFIYQPDSFDEEKVLTFSLQ